MRISPEVTNILLDIQPSFREYTNPDRTLVVELDRALYGCIESALLWFKELTSFLATLHLVPNPHDLCVMNLNAYLYSPIVKLWSMVSSQQSAISSSLIEKLTPFLAIKEKELRKLEDFKLRKYLTVHEFIILERLV